MRTENKYTVEELSVKEIYNLAIQEITIKDNCLTIKGLNLTATICDEVSCCESRYMVCEDDLSSFIGAQLLRIEYAENVAQDEDQGSYTDVGWLKVTTTQGVFTVNTYNENGGYYSGLSPVLTVYNNC